MQNLQDYFDNIIELDNKNFHKIYKLSSRQLYGVIFRMLRNKQLSEECLQEVFIKIYKNFGSYNKEKAQALTWMITIARNYTIDFIRKKQLQIADDFDLSVIDDEQIQILQTIENNENKQMLERCLDRKSVV